MTGLFLTTRDLLITNHHVLPDLETVLPSSPDENSAAQQKGRRRLLRPSYPFHQHFLLNGSRHLRLCLMSEDEPRGKDPRV
jgi:hypothetical protein